MTTFRCNIMLEPAQLDFSYKTHLLNKMKLHYEKQCTNQYGYIISVDDIETIHGNTIAPADCSTVFDTTFKITALKIEIGCVLLGTVCMVFPYGVFVEIFDKVNVLVPSKNLEEFKYNSEDILFEHDNITIKKGVKIEVILCNVRYEKKKYVCIGRFKALVY